MRALSLARVGAAWLRVSIAVVAAVLVFDFVYLYLLKFDDFVHSDAAVTAIMAKGALARRLPVDVDWYFANGDVWLFAPHLYAMPLVAIWGISVSTLLAAVMFGFALEVVALMWSFTKLGGDRRAAVLGTALTLVAWSRLHILFVYVELSYGFVATLYVLLFATHALLFHRLASRPSSLAWAGCAIFTFIASAQNPLRAVVFAVAPLMVAFAWPWRGMDVRARAIGAAVPITGLVAAILLQKLVLQPFLAYSVPSGHLDFVIRDGAGIASNAANMARGGVALVGDLSSFAVWSAFGLALLALSLVLVVRHALSRTPTPLRFVCVAALVQLCAVGGPMLVGNLVVNPVSIRYLIPSLLTVLGLGGVIAVQLVRESRALGLAFCALAPIAATLTTLRVIGSYSLAQESTTGQFAHSASHQQLADELTARSLRHGFATYWNAHLVTLLSRGNAKTCPVNFANIVLPYRWNTDTWCYDAKVLPDRIFVVGTADERATATPAIEATLGTPVERFSVGDTFFVSVFRTADVSDRWLLPPLPEPERLRFPLRVEASHPQVRVGDHATLEGGKIVANGEEGVLSFGPYVDLPAGDYRLRWIGAPLNDAGELGFDVTATGAARQLAEKSIAMNSIAAGGGGEGDRTIVELSFRLPKRTSGVELRTFSRGGARVALAAFELSR